MPVPVFLQEFVILCVGDPGSGHVYAQSGPAGIGQKVLGIQGIARHQHSTLQVRDFPGLYHDEVAFRLKDRQDRRLDLDDIRTYCRMVTAIGVTLRIQEEINNLYSETEKDWAVIS